MPKYLFTSDQRISALPDRIKWVAEFINSGHNVSEIADKSDNNNAATLKFYYNLHSGTETCEKAVENPVFAIRNFVLKFQFPNARTQESLQNTLNERLLLAPYRSVVSLLVALAEITNSDTSALSVSEILYYVFCNPIVYNNPAVNYKEVAAQILVSREQNKDFEDVVSNILEWNQYGRQSRELINVLTYASKCFSFTKGILKYSTTHEDYLIDKGYIDELITYNKFWYPSNTQDFKLATLEYISYMNTVNTPYSVVEFSPNTVEPKKEIELKNLQQIYYGAPGTGKSYKINEITKSTKNFTRTTFHPDSDYSTFVGCYKPTMEPTGTIVGGKEQTKISYSYVAQAFLQAYTAAWKNTSEPYYLIIEEINRGNCAQIFGDLFQLLDRDENGMSSYGITPDKDIANYLRKEFAKSEIENTDIKNGNTMMLPSNLYILATMNTSDQSLFPIDSAFKRRWDWEYVPIEDAGKKHCIKVGNKKYEWWTFIDTINNSIDHITGSEDKKMGYWFVKPQNNDREITAKQFVGKVLFYLWNDVYKDYFDMSQCIFKIKNEDGTDEKKPFTYFFGNEADKRIQAFMAYNKIPIVDENK